VPGKAVGQAAVELPWLCPSTDSLIALADAPASVAGLSAADPALALFLLRFAQPAPEPDTFGFAPGALLSAILLETASAFLAATKTGVLPDSSFALGRVRAVAERAAEIAAALASATRLVPAIAAATVARLAPLGWYAVAAVDPFDAADPLGDPQFGERPGEVQTEVWGLDHASIARRLAARWRLPGWVAGTIGSLTLPLRVAENLVAHADLFAVVQLAVLESEAEGVQLGLAHGASRGELLDHLRLDDRALAGVAGERRGAPARSSGSGFDPNPHRVLLIRNLLRQAAEARRRNGPALVARLEEHIDALHRVAANLAEQVGDRLRDAKLAALAELAAGAGHEINNPLAVISGNAQRLSRTELDPERGESLQAIVRQANRIAGILRDLMQFARPPRPELRAFPLSELLYGVRDDFAALAAERGVGLELAGVPADVWLDGDPRQLRHALGAIVRNAIEAAAAGGWVRVSCSAPEEAGSAAVAVEDSGPGMTPEVAEHAFDPFFSGRTAGRGRGLGLPTAWQLIRQNGGELHFEPVDGGPTRFVLTARRAAGCDLLSLRSA
jgi:two-component system, NtrC family, sensor kinase